MQNKTQTRWGWGFILAGLYIAFAVNGYLTYYDQLVGLVVIFAGAWLAFIKDKDSNAAPPAMQKVLGWAMLAASLYIWTGGNGYPTSDDKTVGICYAIAGFLLALILGRPKSAPVPPVNPVHPGKSVQNRDNVQARSSKSPDPDLDRVKFIDINFINKGTNERSSHRFSADGTFYKSQYGVPDHYSFFIDSSLFTSEYFDKETIVLLDENLKEIPMKNHTYKFYAEPERDFGFIDIF